MVSPLLDATPLTLTRRLPRVMSLPALHCAGRQSGPSKQVQRGEGQKEGEKFDGFVSQHDDRNDLFPAGRAKCTLKLSRRVAALGQDNRDRSVLPLIRTGQ